MKIVTEIILVPKGNKNTPTKEEVSSAFWRAEDYHQNYFEM